MSGTEKPKTQASHPFEDAGINSLDRVPDYEREKILATIRDLELTAATLRRYLAYTDLLDAKDIPLKDRVSLLSLRIPGGPAGPGNDILEIQVMAQNALIKAEESLKGAQVDTPLLEARRVVENQVVSDQITAVRKRLTEFEKFNK